MRAIASLVGAIMFAANSSWAEERAAVDTRSGTVRIYISVATSAAARLVTALKGHFPNLKIEFVRAGSVETVRRFVAERQAGRIGADLIHGADPGGFEYFAQKGWLDKRLVAPAITKDYRDGFFNANAGWVALRATGIAPMYNTSLVKKETVPVTWKELNEPKWKGRVAISDPTRAGSSFSHLYAMWKMYGAAWIEKFAGERQLRGRRWHRDPRSGSLWRARPRPGVRIRRDRVQARRASRSTSAGSRTARSWCRRRSVS